MTTSAADMIGKRVSFRPGPYTPDRLGVILGRYDRRNRSDGWFRVWPFFQQRGLPEPSPVFVQAIEITGIEE